MKKKNDPPQDPTNLKGLRIDVFEDKVLPLDLDDPISTGRPQIHIYGTPFSFIQLGQFLIDVANYNSSQDFMSHLDPIQGGWNGSGGVHLVVHHKNRKHIGPTVQIIGSSA